MHTGPAVLRTCLAIAATVTLLADVAAAQCNVYSSTRVLDFSAPTPSVILDKNGFGTGFDTRLPGTGDGIVGNDLNLELDDAAGELRVQSTRSDLNGQQTLSQGVYPGIRLSSLGFTGSQDFCVSASFSNVQLTNLYDQFGIYVGASSTAAVRAGAFFNGSPTMLNVWTLGFGDLGINVFPFQGGVLNAQISRTAGVFSMFVGGVDLSTILGTNELNAFSDLTVGIFAANAFNDVPKTATLSEFRVGVDAAQVPEPSSLVLLLVGLAAIVACRARCHQALN